MADGHRRLNTGRGSIANKYREGKVKRTLRRESKVRETVSREADLLTAVWEFVHSFKEWNPTHSTAWGDDGNASSYYFATAISMLRCI